MNKMVDALLAIKKKYDGNAVKVTVSNDGTTAVFEVDMINDFCFTSAMANPLAVEIISPIEEFLRAFSKAKSDGDNIIHINEGHSKESVEFNEYPEHGVRGTLGAALAGGIGAIPSEGIIYKNSTNGFHIELVKSWLMNHPDIKRVVVVGVLSDICVMQFAVSLKTFCNQVDRQMEVIIPQKLVESYEAPGHNRDLFYYTSLEYMAQAGCIIAAEIEVI